MDFLNVVFTYVFPDLSNHFTIKMAQGDQQQFCLRWNDFQTNMVSSFKHLRDEKSFTDVTLACDGQTCKAHKMVLSACSPYFKVNKPTIVEQTLIFSRSEQFLPKSNGVPGRGEFRKRANKNQMLMALKSGSKL